MGAVFWAGVPPRRHALRRYDGTCRDRSVANPAEIFRDKRAWLYLCCAVSCICASERHRRLAAFTTRPCTTWQAARPAYAHPVFLGALVVRMLRRWCIAYAGGRLSLSPAFYPGRRVLRFAADAVFGCSSVQRVLFGAAGGALHAGCGNSGYGDPLLRDVPYSDGFGLIHHRAGRIPVSADRAHSAGAAHRAGKATASPCGGA